MYAAMPAYLYLNADILGYLLRPLLEYQNSSQYPNSYAAQNLGAWANPIKTVETGFQRDRS
jgi:hypothetical protein